MVRHSKSKGAGGRPSASRKKEEAGEAAPTSCRVIY